MIRTLRRVASVAAVWTILWLAFWALVVTIIYIVDPDSIDSGEGPMVMLAVLGPMGLLSGMVFGVLLSIGDRDRAVRNLSFTHVVGSGIIASAIVQVGYLGHGDQGLAANIQMALLLCAFSGVVTMAWLATTRKWLRPDRAL